MATSAYLSIADAQAYFDERLGTDAWDGATDTDKTKALKQATRIINNLNFNGDKTVANQANEFPRGGDTQVPAAITGACCEEALSLLDGADISLEKANLTASSQGVGDARGTYDRDIAIPHIAAGFTSSVAWSMIRPYLRDSNEVLLRRGS